ncbi:hypothetical protein [Paenibacillus sp. SI8]|uniref:hypothetical protein n=1 Tax=unclassified Paenibacillus TaxID=185978 RepID=UPI003467788A
MEPKIGLLMDLPEGKIPGFYAQVIKALAGKVELFDRDKDMLIVNNEAQLTAALGVMSQFHIETELMQLTLLPDESELTDLFSDYGFISRAEHFYLYAKLVCSFIFAPNSPQGDTEQAVLQMEEHLIAQYEHQGQNVYVADRQLTELMQGIAKAYRCQIDIRS